VRRTGNKHKAGYCRRERLSSPFTHVLSSCDCTWSPIVKVGVTHGGASVDQTAKRPRWQRGGGCASGTCVEVAKVDDRYLIRDSKNPDAAVLAFTKDEWDAFTRAVKRDQFRFD
jgi:hypothetical protein